MAKKGSQLTVRTATEIQGGEFVILGYAGKSYQMTLDELKKFIGIIEEGGGSVDLTQVSTDILPLADASKDIGSLEKRWKKIYSTALTVKAQSVDEEEVNIHDGGIEGKIGQDIQWSIDGSGKANFYELTVNGADVATMQYVNNELSKYVTTDTLTKNYVSNTSLTEILKKYYESGYVDFLLSSKASTGDLNKTNTQLGIVQTDVATLKSYFQDTDDVDDIINKWRELEAFLAGQTETSTLADLLTLKADKSTVVAINSRVTDLEDADFVDIDSLRTALEDYYTKEEVNGLLGEAGGVDLTGYVNEIAASGTGNGIASVSKDGSKLTFTKANFLTSHQSLDGYINSVSDEGSGNVVTAYRKSGKSLVLQKGLSVYSKAEVDELIDDISIPDLDGYVTTDTLTESLNNLSNTYLSFRDGGTVSGATTFSGGLSVQNSLTLLGVNVAAGSSGLTFGGKIPMYSGDAYTKSEADKKFHLLTTVDTTPTNSSTNLITSGGVFKMVADLDTTISSNFLLKTTAASTYLSLSGGQIDGPLTIAYGADLILKASPSSTGDSGDLVFYNYSGKEIGRIWHNAGVFCLRYAENDSTKEIIHSGNIADYAIAKNSEAVLSRLTVESGSDAKIILNNTDTESKYQYISFRQNGTEYGALGTFYDDNLIWNQSYILHSKNYSNYALPLTGGAVSGAFSIKTETTNDSFFQIRNSIYGGVLFYGGIAEGEAVRIEAANGEGTWLGQILRLWLNGDVEVSGELRTFSGNKYIHSGNIGSYAVTSTTLNDFPRLNGTSPSGAAATGTWGINISGSAAKLGGIDAGSYFCAKEGLITSSNVNTTLNNGVYYTEGYTPISGAYNFGTFINFRSGAVNVNSRQAQFYITDGAQQKFGGIIYYRDYWNAESSINTKWYQLARITDNVASATKLQTARTIWGQSFDGTGNVDGILTLNYSSTSRATGVEVVSTNSAEASIGFKLNDINRAVVGVWSSALNLWTQTKGTAISIPIATGNVGIGTYNPQYKLDVIGDFCVNRTDHTASNTTLRISNSDNNVSFYVDDADDAVCDLRFVLEGTERLRLTSSGNVCIGTTNSAYKLRVAGNGAFNNEICVYDADDIYRLTCYEYQGIGRIYSYNETDDVFGDLWIGNNNGGIITVKASGNVGIGTTNPNTKLHVVGGAKIEEVLTVGDVTLSGSSGDLEITPSGNVIINGSDLEVGGSGSFISLTVNTNTYLQGGSTNPYLRLLHNSTNYYVQAYNGSLMLGAGANNSMWIDANGNVEIQKAFDVNHADGYVRIVDGSIVAKYGTSTSWEIMDDGSAYFAEVNTPSDSTKKNILSNIVLTTAQIANAPAVSFTWKASGRKSCGTIAQYWEEVLPEVVSGEEGNYGMNYAVLGVVSSIILARNIETHEQRIARLEKEISDLQKELNALVNNE